MIAIQKKYEDYAACCASGLRDFTHGVDTICVTRNSKNVLVCEKCLARVGVANREKKNVVHTGHIGNTLP